jgi:hypothetical protein
VTVNVLRGIPNPMVRAIVRRRETMGRVFHVLVPAGVVQGSAVPVVPADQDSAGREGLAVVPECGLVPTGAAVVPVDFPRALVPEVAFLVDKEVVFLVDRAWGLADRGTSFRKTPKWPR